MIYYEFMIFYHSSALCMILLPLSPLRYCHLTPSLLCDVCCRVRRSEVAGAYIIAPQLVSERASPLPFFSQWKRAYQLSRWGVQCDFLSFTAIVFVVAHAHSTSQRYECCGEV